MLTTEVLPTIFLFHILKARALTHLNEIMILGKWAKVLWKGNWVTFLDTVMQTMLFSALTRSTLVPVRFREVTINPAELMAYVESVKSAEEKVVLNAEEIERAEEGSGHEKKVEKDVQDDGMYFSTVETSKLISNYADIVARHRFGGHSCKHPKSFEYYTLSGSGSERNYPYDCPDEDSSGKVSLSKT